MDSNEKTISLEAFNLSEQIKNLQQLIAAYRPDYSLPAQFYTDKAVYQADLQAVFYKKWIYAGHVSQIAETGCYFLTEFCGESIIVVRDDEGKIRAFANVCRHRGSKVCLESSGRTRLFVCPYHAWAYQLDGKLRSKRSMPADFDQSDYGLKPVGVDVLCGLIFINLDAAAPGFSEGLGAMVPALEIYRLEDTKVACQKTFTVDANWKLAIENFMECYHCTPAHKEYSCSHALNSPADYERLRPDMLVQAESLGYQIESVDQSKPQHPDAIQHFYNRSAMYEPYVTGSEDGAPLAPLLGDIGAFGGGAADMQFGPVTYAIAYPDHLVLYRFLPAGIEKTDMDIIWLVNKDAEQGVDYDLDKLTWLWTVTTEADKTIILNNQKGVNSIFYQPGPLSDMESYITTFLQWYIGQLRHALQV